VIEHGAAAKENPAAMNQAQTDGGQKGPAAQGPGIDSVLASTAAIGSKMPIGITAFGSWMLGVGSMIGSMAWLIHGYMLSRAGAAPTLAAWVLAALINLPLCFILAELSSMFPAAGGPYIYKYVALKRLFPAYGQFLGFCTGWLYWVTMISGLSCMANGFAALIATTLYKQANLAPFWLGPVAIVALFAGTTLLNLNPVASISRINNFFTFVKLAMVAVFAALVCGAKTSSLSYILPTASSADFQTVASQVMKVLVLAITAFAGIEVVACTSSETEDAKHNISRAIFLTLGTVALIYLVMAVSVFSSAQFMPSKDGYTMLVPGTDFSTSCPSLAEYLGGPFWGRIFAAGVGGSIITCGFGCILALARITYSMSQTKLFPAKFSNLTEKSGVPKDALLFQFFCLSIVGVGTNIASRHIAHFDGYSFLGEVFGFLYSLLAVLYGFSLISLRYTEPKWPRPFRLGQGNVMAWMLGVFTAGVYAFVAFACAQLPTQLTALGLLLCGVPIYWIYYNQPQNGAK
jgi:APA family basic amino acid/polyamine antiporter